MLLYAKRTVKANSLQRYYDQNVRCALYKMMLISRRSSLKCC